MIRNLLVLVPALLLLPGALRAQAPADDLRDSLRSVLQQLVAVHGSRAEGEYSETRSFFADSVSCIGGAGPITTCAGAEREALRFGDASGMRARLLLGHAQGWSFDWESLQVLARAPDLAVATVRWTTEPRDTTVSVRCDPRQPAAVRQAGVWTLVFQRRGEQWRIRHAHESAGEFTSYPGCPAGQER